MIGPTEPKSQIFALLWLRLKLTQDRANQLLAVIARYLALGGGWQNQDAHAKTINPQGKL